jgi:hypothetical protein
MQGEVTIELNHNPTDIVVKLQSACVVIDALIFRRTYAVGWRMSLHIDLLNS